MIQFHINNMKISYKEVLNYLQATQMDSLGFHDAEEEIESDIPDFHRAEFYTLEEVNLTDIPEDPAPNQSLVLKYVDKYKEGSNFPPIVLSVLNNEIMDGRHRVAAARRLNLKTISAYNPIKN